MHFLSPIISHNYKQSKSLCFHPGNFEWISGMLFRVSLLPCPHSLIIFINTNLNSSETAIFRKYWNRRTVENWWWDQGANDCYSLRWHGCQWKSTEFSRDEFWGMDASTWCEGTALDSCFLNLPQLKKEQFKSNPESEIMPNKKGKRFLSGIFSFFRISKGCNFSCLHQSECT